MEVKRFLLFRPSRFGFTLVEILVSISITALLSGLIITYTSTGRAQVALYVEEAKMAQVILKSKSLAISTYNQPDIPCGYGVHFDYSALTYTLFSYRAGDCNVIPSIDFAGAGVTTIESFTLASQLLYDNQPSGITDILFVPPDPKTLVWTQNGPTSSGKIYLTTKDGKGSIAIAVSNSGQISF